MRSFSAFRIHNDNGLHRAALEQIELNDLTEGDVVIEAHYSGVNYKDALAGSGKGKILRRFPLNGGVDVSGVVYQSEHTDFKPGDKVLISGAGMGESFDGGYSEYVRAKSEHIVHLPEELSLYDAMVMGTPALTAALALYRMEENCQSPDKGPILITGAGGGVGNIAVDIFAKRGYEVIALTGKATNIDTLKRLGATNVLLRNEVEMGSHPLESALWGGAVDTVGGETLAWLTRTTKEWGNIACIGLAAGAEINTTVMPFILRGVSLLGISSTNCPAVLRRALWKRLGKGLRPQHLDQIATEMINLNQLPEQFEKMLAGNTHGRCVVKIK